MSKEFNFRDFRFASHDIRVVKHLYCGKKLGHGAYRDVYEFKLDPRYVIKHERRATFSNIAEWEIWSELYAYEHKMKKHFADCMLMSHNGKFLIQKKITFKQKEKYPALIPHFFNDQKITNYGWIGSRFVCCDYGNFSLIKGLKNIQKKAHWWEVK